MIFVYDPKQQRCWSNKC